MDPLELMFYVSRLVHIGTAIVLVGGVVFMRYVLMPAATAVLTPETHTNLRSRIMGTWKIFVHGGIALFLLSGGINYWRAIGLHKGDKLYHALMGTKILLALAVFFIASALVGRKLDAIRNNPRLWLTVTVLLAAIIVAISSYLRMRTWPPLPVL